MDAQEDDNNRGGVLALILAMAGLMVALVIGVAVQHQGGPAQPVSALTTTTSLTPAPSQPPALLAVPVAVPLAPEPDEGGASVIVQNGVLTFYFAPNESALAAGGRDALTQIVKAVAGGKKAVISGFHDSTGDALRNVALARQRALAVRQALIAMGVGEAQIELKKPEQAPGRHAEARRVEVALE